MVICPNGHANPDHQQYCGQCGAPLAVPSRPPHVSWPPAVHPPAPSRRRQSGRLLIAAISVAVVAIVAALTVWLTNRQTDSDRTDGDRWSGFPHTMRCVQDRMQDPDVRQYDLHLPDAARVPTVDLTHLDGQRVKLSLHFLQAPPSVPRAARSPYNGQLIDAPGTLKYSVILFSDTNRKGDQLFLNSPSRDNPGWSFLPSQVPEQENRSVLVSSETRGNVVDLVLDLNGLTGFLGNGPLRPRIDVSASGVLRPDPDFPQGAPGFIDDQNCEWDNTRDASTSQPGSSPGPITGALPSATEAAPAPGAGGPVPTSQTVPAPNPGVWQFQSPTGNIVCNMSPTGAACEIREHDYPVPGPPPNCAEYGDRFNMDIGGRGAMVCHMGNFFGQPLPTQAYDTPLSAGPITCVVNEQTGVTCRDTSTGHFFQVSKQSYRVG
jgi:hypothetical protein